MSSVVFQIKYSAKKPPRIMSAEQKREYVAERSFYDWTASYNFTQYVLDGKKVETNKDFNDYATRQGNLGMFDQNHVLSAEEIEDVKKSLQNTDSHIWHGFISFDATLTNKFQTQEQAMHFLKQHFIDFIRRTHLDPDNICLVSALHKDTEHRHIHFSFFEKEPKHLDKFGRKGYTTKGNFKQEVIDNWLISANMAVGEKDDYYASRNALLSKLREIKGQVTKEFTSTEMQLKLLALARKFPKESRLSYASENMAKLRPEIDKLVKIILCSSPEVKELHQSFMKEFTKREKRVKTLAKENKVKNKVDYMDKLRQDYQTRLGNLVIGLAKEMKREYFANYYQPSDKAKRVTARRTREHAKRVYTQFTRDLVNTLGQIQKNMQTDFSKTVRDNEEEIKREMLLEEAMRGEL